MSVRRRKPARRSDGDDGAAIPERADRFRRAIAARGGDSGDLHLCIDHGIFCWLLRRQASRVWGGARGGGPYRWFGGRSKRYWLTFEAHQILWGARGDFRAES